MQRNTVRRHTTPRSRSRILLAFSLTDRTVIGVVALNVSEDSLDDHEVFDAGDNLHRAPAVLTGLNVG